MVKKNIKTNLKVRHSRKVGSKTRSGSIFSRIGNPFLRKRKKKKSGLKKRFQYMNLRRYLFFHSSFSGKPLAGILKKFRKKRYRNRFFIRSRKLIDYKNIKLLHRFIGWQGKIIPRRVSRVSFAVQRLLSAAIKKARILGLLPFVENEKHSQKVRMLKQRIKEKKKEKRYKKKDSSSSSKRYKKKDSSSSSNSKWKREPDSKKKDKGTAKPGKTSK